MRTVAQRLIAEELRAGGKADTAGHAAFRVCEKLRQPLSSFAGTAGFRALLARALSQAKVDVPWLAGLKINPGGSFDFPNGNEVLLSGDEAALGGAALTERLLGLLATFIGEALTLRLLHDVWPKAAVRDLNSRGN